MIDPFIEPHPDLTPAVLHGLGWLYLTLCLMNAGWAYHSLKVGRHFRIFGAEIPNAAIWAIYSSFLGMIAFAHFTWTSFEQIDKFLLRLPDWFKEAVNSQTGPVVYFIMSITVLGLIVLLRKWLVKPAVGWGLLNASLLFMTLSMTDYDFRKIVGKPDNVPIVSMLFIVGFFTWLYFYRAVENDRRLAEGLPPVEAEKNEKVLVWPDLVYTELICMVLVTVLLIVWGIVLQAPLEEPATSAKTPNPSKAPWYFLGLQEMLVYYDPWLAGVVFPTMILVGLMAVPYIDFNKVGCGYYVFETRKFAVVTFMFGFISLWIAMIVLGTFLRGPNWNIFGIYEYWDVHKLEALTNVMLSELYWIDSPWAGLLDGVPRYDPADPAWKKIYIILKRESPGFVAILLYFTVLPPLMAVTVLRRFFERMGFLRFMVFTNLLLMMAALPIKMVLRWSLNLKYLINIPEWFFNV